MSEFQREERFIVIKRKHLPPAKEDRLWEFLHSEEIGTAECVVVESDWPEYETVWSMIEARHNGSPPPSQHREPIEADRNWLPEDIWLSIPRYMHKSIVKYAARHRLAFSTPAASDAEGWRPIATAPRDRSWILAQLAQIEDERWSHLSGRHFVIRHEGNTPSGYDMGWGLFPGMGGVPDLWIAGWMPLPATPSTEGRKGEDQADG
jgi:hypothetical protein